MRRLLLPILAFLLAAPAAAQDTPRVQLLKLVPDDFGFVFVAHEPGDANRSAVVERNFDYIENNFYPGRSFEDLADLNAQLRAWCDRVNRSARKLWGESRAVPFELFCAERPLLRALPLHVPEVYELHSRRVDVEGYVTLHTNRYSGPVEHLGRRLEVRESVTRVRIFDGHRLVADHERLEPGAQKRRTLPEHRGQSGRKGPPPPSAEEQTLRAAAPDDVVCAFILPPSHAELERRLRARAQDDEAVIARRMARSAHEIAHWTEYDYVLVNSDVEETYARLATILAAERMKRPRQLGLARFAEDLANRKV